MSIREWMRQTTKPMAKLLKWMTMLLIPLYGLTLSSCGDDNDEPNNQSASIVGTWVDGDETLKLGKDGSYREDGYLGQYRIGTFSYNPNTSLMVVNIQAIEGMNNAYQNTYIVQTLNATTLVLLYKDGDTKGFYTRQ